MKWNYWRGKGSGAAAAVAVGVLAAAGIFWWMANGQFAVRDGGVFAGWVMGVLVGQTVLGIWRGALLAGGRERAGQGGLGPPTASGSAEAFVRNDWRAWPVEMSGVLAVLAVGGFGGVGWGASGRAVLVMLAWLWMWDGAGRWLGRFGAGFMVGVVLVISMGLFAGPVVLVPVIHAAAGRGAQGAEGGQRKVAEGVMLGCPGMGILQGLMPGAAGVAGAGQGAGAGGVRVDWNVLPGMYAYSGLGQEVPAELPRWWESVGAFGAMGAVLGGGKLLTRKRCAVQSGEQGTGEDRR